VVAKQRLWTSSEYFDQPLSDIGITKDQDTCMLLHVFNLMAMVLVNYQNQKMGKMFY